MGTVFLHGNSGGGAGLNFKIVGGTVRPAAVRENTIWVNTSVDISSYALGPTAPLSPVEGMVYIRTGVKSRVTINTLKKNAIRLCLMDGRQYVEGAWVGTDVECYQSGEWVKLTNSLYSVGMPLVPFVQTSTPDFGGYTQGTYGGTEKGHVLFNDDHIELYAHEVSGGNNSIQFLGTDEPIDVRDVDTLVVRFSSIVFTSPGFDYITTGSNWIAISATPEKMFPGNSAGASYKVIGNTQEFIEVRIDVSGLDSVYIVVTVYMYTGNASVTAKLTGIDLE